MCGIAGVIRITKREALGGGPAPDPRRVIPEAWLDILDDSIKHRGPDGQGRFRDRVVRADGSVVDVAFVHRRLSIIDHAGGHQPMVSERGRDGEGLVAVVFNGCIYNHRELRRELQAAGREFVSDHSDTEVLIHGWREWGRDLPKWLDGMFAFAVWDRGRAELFLARDRAGEKPLYVVMGHPSDTLFPPSHLDELPQRTAVFASTPSAWRHLGYQPQRPDYEPNWERYFLAQGLRNGYGYGVWQLAGRDSSSPLPSAGKSWMVPGAATRSNIEARATGHEGRWSDGSYWRPDGERTVMLQADWLDEYLLPRAVRSRLESDVPLGCFLSGGVDSSLIAHYAKRELGSLRTFTVRMPDDRYDESRFAAAAAAHLGTDHATLECAPKPAEDLVRLITQLGLPFGDSSLLPTYWVSRAAAEHVKVALTGDGADELFCGYERHRAAILLRRWRGVLRLLPHRLLPLDDPKSRASKLARLIVAARHGTKELGSIFETPDLCELFGVRDLLDLVPVPHTRKQWAKRGPYFPTDLAAIDFDEYLPGDLLTKVDTASMAVPLEVRAPFLEIDLMEEALHTTLDSLMPNGRSKGLLKQVARRHLPASIVDRPKMGFAIPVGEWFRTDYGGMKTLLMDRLHSVEPFGPPSLGIELNMAFVRRMIDEHMGRKRDHSQRLYMLLVLSIWADWIGGLRGVEAGGTGQG